MLEVGESRVPAMKEFIWWWSGRIASERLAGMCAPQAGCKPKRTPAKLDARVPSDLLKREPSDGSTHWSSDKRTAELGDGSSHAKLADYQRLLRAKLISTSVTVTGKQRGRGQCGMR